MEAVRKACIGIKEEIQKEMPFPEQMEARMINKAFIDCMLTASWRFGLVALTHAVIDAIQRLTGSRHGTLKV